MQDEHGHEISANAKERDGRHEPTFHDVFEAHFGSTLLHGDTTISRLLLLHWTYSDRLLSVRESRTGVESTRGPSRADFKALAEEEKKGAMYGASPAFDIKLHLHKCDRTHKNAYRKSHNHSLE